MAMQAAYMMVDDAVLDRLVQTPGGDLADALEQLEGAGTQTMYLDKMWDALHFLLTGVSASSPIEDDGLSEAVVGVHVFDTDDFIGCTELDELPDIIAALEGVSLPALLAAADFGAFARAEVYPNIWTEDPAGLAAELGQAFSDVLEVHRACLAAKKHLVVSIL